MRVWTAVFVCVLLVVFAAHGYAQIDGSAIPECGSGERYEIAGVLREYRSDIRDISNQSALIDLSEYVDRTEAVDQLLMDMHDLQLRWRHVDEPRLPRCALAVNAGIALGELLDEMLISFLLLDADYVFQADWHANTILELFENLWTLLDELEDKSAA